MRLVTAIATLLGFALPLFAFDHTPSLLLTPKLLRRLERDRTRQTVRWQNFQKRIETSADSPERGFELALYYAITHDFNRGKEAVDWALAHTSDTRQAALVMDWTSDLLTPEQVRTLSAVPAQNPRDRLFLALATDRFDKTKFASGNQQTLAALKSARVADPSALYRAIEYLMAYRAATGVDLRESDPAYFGHLPKLLLLSLNPQQVEHPDWMAHVAALALVTLDPNLESSQFLQGWAMEDRQMLREGPGVGYELLWGDPYLPGIAYQNMDPWTYDPSGLLFARTSWQTNACWISITPAAQNAQNCEAPTTSTKFGSLTAVPFAGKCAAVPQHPSRESVAFIKLPPAARLTYEVEHQRVHAEADPAGIWLAPREPVSRVCLVN